MDDMDDMDSNLREVSARTVPIEIWGDDGV